MANGEESSTFKTRRGLRQGEPLSPLLFNLVGDVLNKMIKKAAGKGYVTGLLGTRGHISAPICRWHPSLLIL
jgi:hypothetical protein